MRTIGLLLAASIAVSAAEVSARQTAPWGSVPGWDIRVDRSLGDGCYAHQAHGDGTTVRIGFDANKKMMYLTIGNPAWQSVEAGRGYRLALVFDDVVRYSGSFKGIVMASSQQVYLDAEDLSDRFAVDFMVRGRLGIYYQGSQIAYLSLANSAAAIAEVTRCQLAINGLNQGTPQQRSDPFKL
jgi:hypothetical protein